MELILLLIVLVAFDLFNNKVLVGEKLQSSQVTLLVLDDSYGTDFSDAPESEFREDEVERVEETKDGQAPKLTSEQRREVRDRLMVLFVIGGLIVLMLSPILDYYRTWILQRVNQFCASPWWNAPSICRCATTAMRVPAMPFTACTRTAQ